MDAPDAITGLQLACALIHYREAIDAVMAGDAVGAAFDIDAAMGNMAMPGVHEYLTGLHAGGLLPLRRDGKEY